MEPVANVTTAVLPEWATAVGSFFVFLITFGFASYGWLKTKFPTEVKTKPAGGDAVVLSASIADSKSINRLAEAINRLVDRNELDTDLGKLQNELIVNRLALIHGELRSLNERLARDVGSTGIR